ncbi:MAG: DUF1353 domain-containing protein [Sphingomonadales bacterium]|nr:MAG: DUF1353 domain-containing protein [Sphingomonadales bacterium]
MPNRREALKASAGLAAFLIPGRSFAQRIDTYFSPVKTEWIIGSRKMRLLEDFSYRDPSGRMWTAKKDWLVDGASIPRLVWSVAGAPFDPPFREASVIHDYYCDVMETNWEETHRVFYDAMITSGTGELEATSKYWAVHRFGPRWDATHRWSGMWPRRTRRTPLAGAVRNRRPGFARDQSSEPSGGSAGSFDPGEYERAERQRAQAEQAAMAEFADMQARIAAGEVRAGDVPEIVSATEAQPQP